MSPAAAGVTAEEATLGGVPGWWVRPANPAAGRAILYLHGGAYVLGSATAYRNFVGQIVARSGVPAFVADYGLAPERPFPAAIEDARRAYDALVDGGATHIALAGDSAGGGLALALLALVKAAPVAPVAAVAMSPWTDLGLESPSMVTQDAADPLLDAASLGATAALYLGDHDRRDPRVSPVHSDRSGLPPVLIHVGDAEVLRDDTLRYAEGVAGVEAHVWEGMTHVFPSSLGLLEAAEQALGGIGAFLRRQLQD